MLQLSKHEKICNVTSCNFMSLLSVLPILLRLCSRW